MNSVQLALRVLRTDHRSRTSAILTAAGVAVAIALVLLLLGVPGATEHRAERAAWQQVSPSAGKVSGATVAMTVAEDSFSGGKSTVQDEPITRVDVAALGDPAKVRLPAGVPRMPGDGQALVSPALAKLIESVPGNQLGDRFGDRIIGTLDEQALRYPEQLVALVGHDRAAMPAGAPTSAGFPTGPVVLDPMLSLLAGVGVVVLLVPSLVLVASSARLTAARRERRLAALRLAGATPGQVIAGVSAENALAAGVGVVAGIAIGPLLRALATNVFWDGGTWQAADFTLPLPASLGVALAIAGLVVLAGVLGLRRVISTPLGAAAGHGRSGPKWWRLLAIPVAALVFVAALRSAKDAGGLLIVFVALAAVIGAFTLIGPWVTALVGSVFVRTWRGPSVLLAGRRLRDDPKGAYRASAGVVLAVFVGSMALTLLPSFEAMGGANGQFRDSVLYAYPGMSTSDSSDDGALAGKELATQTNDRLSRFGVGAHAVSVRNIRLGNGSGQDTFPSAMVLGCADARALTTAPVGQCGGRPAVYTNIPLRSAGLAVAGAHGPLRLPAGTPVHRLPASSDGESTLIIDPRLVPTGSTVDMVSVAVPTSTANRDTVRTALAGAGVGTQVESIDTRLAGQQSELDDLRRVTVIGLVAAGILAGASAAIATAGSVLDRRRTFGSLLAAGTPVRVLARALRTEAALPALVATIGGGLGGSLVGVGLLTLFENGSAVLTPWVFAPVVLGVGVAVLAASACTPALRRVAAEPLSDE